MTQVETRYKKVHLMSLKMYTDMAKYFQVVNDSDNSIVIDDTFKNLELLQTVKLSDCTFIQEYNSSHGYYKIPSFNSKTALIGLGINALSGVPYFGMSAGSGVIEFYDAKSSISGHGLYPVKRDDISSKATIYCFGFGNNSPSASGAGLEIYNASGKVIYSSNKQYLDVIQCGSDEESTVPISGTSIAFVLGTDHASQIWENHKAGAKGATYDIYPKFTVSNSSVTIGKVKCQITYIPSDTSSHLDWDLIDDSCYFNYGWLIGRLTN